MKTFFFEIGLAVVNKDSLVHGVSQAYSHLLLEYYFKKTHLHPISSYSPVKAKYYVLSVGPVPTSIMCVDFKKSRTLK